MVWQKVKTSAAASNFNRAVTYDTSSTSRFHPSGFNAESKNEAQNLILLFAASGNCKSTLSAASS